MKKYNIILYCTENEEMSSIIGRYNRTQRMTVMFEVNKNVDGQTNYKKGVKTNNSKHRTSGMKPTEVNKNNDKA